MILTVVSPDDERTHCRIDRSPFRIGRLPDLELSLKDSRVSRKHAQILLEDNKYYIEDCDSRHGLFVNGRKVSRAKLKARDRIDFGIEDSYELFVGEERRFAAPLLTKVAALPSESTGNLGRLSAVLDVARVLESSGSVDEVLAAAVDAALAVTGAERGFLMLQRPGNSLETRIARDSAGRSLPADELSIARDILGEALTKRSDLFTMSFNPDDGEVSPGDSSQAPDDARSVLCVPVVRIRLDQQGETSVLSAAQDTIGLLYMDSSETEADLAEGNRAVLQTLAIEISTVLENARLLEQERKKHHLEQELQIARDIQQGLLPSQLPAEGWLVAAGSSQACFQVGGDYYDVIEIEGGRWGGVLADVSGKGVSAALLTSLLQGAFFSASWSDSGLGAAVGRINRYISERSRNARFATAFCCVIEGDGVMRWVNAGHTSTVVLRANGSIEWLKASSVPIGLFPDAEYVEETCDLGPNDKLVVYSDGVSEANNFKNERYGEERLENFLKEQFPLAARDLHDALMDDVFAFTEGAEQGDDITLLVVGYRG